MIFDLFGRIGKGRQAWQKSKNNRKVQADHGARVAPLDMAGPVAGMVVPVADMAAHAAKADPAEAPVAQAGPAVRAAESANIFAKRKSASSA